jgi:hypothetical protein
MYLVNFGLLKCPQSTNGHLGIENLDRNFDLKTTL